MSFKIIHFLIFLYRVHFCYSLVTCESGQTNQTCIPQPSTNESSSSSAEAKPEKEQVTDTLISNPLEENGDNSTVGVDISVFGLRDFTDELKSLLGGIVILLRDVIPVLNATFQDFVNSLFDEQNVKKLIEEVRSLSEVQRVANFLHGFIDVDKVVVSIYKFLGWTEEAESVQ